MSKNTAGQAGYSLFFETVAKAPRPLFLVDYEGVLAPPSVGYGCQAAYPGIPDRLQSVLRDRRTRLIVISGSPAQDVRISLGMTTPPEIWGGDGLERIRSDGHCEFAELDISADGLEALTQSEATLRRLGIGKFIQVNLAGISVRWPGLSDVDDLLEVRAKACRVFRPLALQHADLRFIEFEAGVELRLRGTSKADALRWLLASTQPETPLAYVGGDRADAEACQILNDRKSAVFVKVRPRTDARFPMKPPEALTRFLDEWIRATQSALRTD